MTKCPKCGKFIEKLVLYGKQTQKFRVFLSEGKLQYEWIWSSDYLEEEEYCCPECKEQLFKSDEEALAFLMSDASKVKQNERKER
jgi:hypothetical protein